MNYSLISQARISRAIIGQLLQPALPHGIASDYMARAYEYEGANVSDVSHLCAVGVSRYLSCCYFEVLLRFRS